MQVWIRRLVRQLAHHHLVERVYLRHTRIKVKYITGFRRNYVFGALKRRYIYKTHITAEQGKIKSEIPIGHQYQWRLMNKPELAKHFLVKREKIKTATYMEKEILVHELLNRIMTTGLKDAYYANDDLLADLENVKTSTAAFYNGIFTIYPKIQGMKPGRITTEMYYDVNSLDRRCDPLTTMNNAFSVNKILYVALQKLINATAKDITINSIRQSLNMMGYGPLYLNPVPYKVILKQLFDLKGKIITDPNPNLASKALAAWALGCGYNPLTPFNMELAEDVGIKIVPQNPPYDILLLDNNFIEQDLAEIAKWRPKCKEMLVYIKNEQLEEARIKYKPTRIVKVRAKAVTPKVFISDYLLIFK